MRCQMKRIEMCFIALHSLGANDYNRLTNVIARWKYFQIFFFFFFFFRFALAESGLEPRQMRVKHFNQSLDVI